MKNILIIDDQPAILQQLKEILSERSDLVIDTAEDESSARALMDAKHYDIALVDIELAKTAKGRLAGLGLQRDLRQKRCITLIVSGTADDTLKSVAAYLSGYDFVSKPVNPIDLLNKVEHALKWAEEQSHTTEQDPNGWPKELATDPNNRFQLTWKGKRVNLTLTQHGLVDRLARCPGKLVSNRDLIHILKSAQGTGALATHFTNIRKAFRDVDMDFNGIQSIPSQGYLWKTD